jgi:RNA polymerase sigma factor (sigma-70 family)
MNDFHSEPERDAIQEGDHFQSFVTRIRHGDQQAAEELVRSYERVVRVSIRYKLTSPSMRRQFDSMDVCQSAFASFFLRVAVGQFDLESPKQLVGLLVAIAQNKLLMQVRRHQQQKRNVNRIESDEQAMMQVCDSRSSPSQEIQAREQLDRLFLMLTSEEQEIANERIQGFDWNAIAGKRGKQPNTVRMQFSRAVDRALKGLGVEPGDSPEIQPN